MNIFQKIQKAKQLILEANLKKSGKNKFAGYTYYELSDLLPKIIQVCNELNLFTRVNFNDEFATLEIINIDKPDEKVEYTSPMKELVLKGANAIQALGGVQTYQRRYLYMSAFDIIENDMFDASPPIQEEQKYTPKKKAPKPETTEVPPPKPETMVKVNEVFAQYAKKINKDIEVVKKSCIGKLGVKSVEELTESQAQEIIVRIAKQLQK